MDKIIAVLRANQDKAPDELVNDFQNLPVNPQTNEYDRDASAAFIKKWAPYIQENFENWEEIDYSANEPLKNRMAKDGVNTDLIGNANYLAGLARKYGSTPEEVSNAFGEILKDKQAADEKQKIADEYKREAELKYNRQKAVDEYEHSYLGMDKDNPLNIGLNKLADFLISDKTKKAVIEDPDNTARALGNVAVDIGGTVADFAPGIGGVVIGPAVRTARNIAEGDDALTVLSDAGTDVVGNWALAHGLKGLPGIGDFGPLRKIEEKIPTNEWAAQAERAASAGKKVADLPKFKTYSEAQEWIMKQPKEHRDMYQKALDESFGGVKKANLEDVQKALTEERKRQNRLSSRAEEWVKEHPVKAGAGKAVTRGTIGAERTAARAKTETATEYKVNNPKKIKTYDDAIGFIIDSNKRQWEAGFKPRDMSGIVGEAYKKWESER